MKSSLTPLEVLLYILIVITLLYTRGPPGPYQPLSILMALKTIGMPKRLSRVGGPG